jgi:hypothetical protein
MGTESLFVQLSAIALKLIEKALAGDAKAFKAIEPLLPRKLKTSVARAAAEARAKRELGS